MGQLDCAGEDAVSTRHLSFVETGRAQASRDRILLLDERLEITLRERNTLRTAAGHAPSFWEKA